MTEINWSELVEYSEESPSGLIWKVTITTGSTGNVILTYPGMVAGTKAHRKNGSAMWWQLGYGGKSYRLHRVLYEVVNGKFNGKLKVDHVDGNPFNNIKTNLRLVTSAINSRNMKAHDRGMEGSGVFFEVVNGCSYFIAHYSENNKLYRKRFSCKKLGRVEAESMAKQYRKDQIERLNDIGYGYTERHGT